MLSQGKVWVTLLTISHLLLIQCKEEEITGVINGKKSINTVSDKFISFSIDPAILIKGNISWSSLQLAQHLSPAYIRIGGASTKFLEYVQHEEIFNYSLEETNKLLISSSMWQSLNEWLKNSNLTPVFALNDNSAKWSPQSILPLLENSDKMNINCYWQLGCGLSKTVESYRNELITFRNIFNDFPSSARWKIVGSNLEFCLPFETTENTRKFADDLFNRVDAIIWEEKKEGPSLLEKDLSKKVLKSQLPFWAIIPKVTQPVSFSSGLEWAKQIGETAKAGYEVIFREPRLHEVFSDTPVYWISLLHKTLMGRIVLDVKLNNNHNNNVSIYAHCAKGQNQYSRRGAITIFAVNYSDKKEVTVVRLTGSNPKVIEVQSYLLTAEESTETYLNGQMLSIKNLTDLQLIIIPKLRRTRTNKHLAFELPPKSVGFFVLPTARAFACIHEEDEMNTLMEELEEDQNIKFSDEDLLQLPPEDSNSIPEMAEETGLVDLYEMMEKELETDYQYYRNVSGDETSTNWKQMLLDRVTKQKNPHEKIDEFLAGKNVRERRSGLLLNSEPRSILPPSLKRIEKSAPDLRTSKVHKVFAESSKKVDNNKEVSNVIEEKVKMEETRKELSKQRRFTDTLLKKARQIKMRKKLMGKRSRRDINMDLLRLKTDYGRKTEKQVMPAFHKPQEIQASIRRPEQTSDEFPSGEEPSNQPSVADEVFAEIASNDNDPRHSNDEDTDEVIKPKKSSKFPQEKKPQKTVKFDGGDDSSEPSVEEDLRSYHPFHENLGHIEVADPPPTSRNKELWEMDELDRRMEEKPQNRIASDTPPDSDVIQTMIQNLDSFLKQTKQSADVDEFSGFGCLEDNYDDINTSEYRRNARNKRETDSNQPQTDQFSNEIEYFVQSPAKRKWRPEDIASIKVKPSYSVEVVEIDDQLSRVPSKRSIMANLKEFEKGLAQLLLPDIKIMDKAWPLDKYTTNTNECEKMREFSTTNPPTPTYLDDVWTSTEFPSITSENQREITHTSPTTTEEVTSTFKMNFTTQGYRQTTTELFFSPTSRSGANYQTYSENRTSGNDDATIHFEGTTTSNGAITDVTNKENAANDDVRNQSSAEMDFENANESNLSEDSLHTKTVTNGSSFFEREMAQIMQFFLKSYKSVHDLLQWFN